MSSRDSSDDDDATVTVGGATDATQRAAVADVDAGAGDGTGDADPHQATVPATGPGMSSSAAAPASSDMPDQIGRFRISEELGRGGMGVVYLAYDPRLDRQVALKLLRPDAGGTSPTNSGRVVREARAAAKLSHPNVVSVYEVGVAEQGPFIALEYVKGPTLGQWLEGTRRSWPEILAKYVEAGRGIAAAHAQSIVHRDIKPANILIGHERVRVTDFGIASSVGGAGGTDLGETISGPGGLIGTPRYMAPEQRRGETCDERSDQYSFCLSLHEGLFDRQPDEPTVDGERTVPAWLRKAVARGLQGDPNKRFESMNALLDVLDRRRVTRRRTAAAVAMSAIGVGVVFFVLGGSSSSVPHDACATVGYEMDTVWNDGRRAELAAAFGKLDSPGAVFTLKRVRTELDRYASVWKTNRVKLCRDREESASDDAGRQLHAARATCLARRLTRTNAAVAVLSEVDKSLVLRAVTVVNDATKDSCDDVSKLSRTVGMPSEELTRGRIVGVQQELDALRPILLGERDAQLVRPTLDRLLSEARALKFTPLLAEVLAVYGSFLNKLREDGAAERMFRETTTVAAAARDDGALVRAWINLMWSVGVRQKRNAEALALVATVESVLARAGNTDVLRARFAHTYASVLRYAGKPKESLAQLELSARLAEKALGPDSGNLAATLQSLGETYRHMRRLKDAESMAKRVISIFEKQLGPQHPKVAAGLSALAEVQKQQGQYGKALKGYKQALKILRGSYGPDHPSISSNLENIAALFAGGGKAAKALPYIQEAVARAERHFGKTSLNVAKYYHQLGSVLIRVGKFKEALTACTRATQLQAEKMATSWAYANSLKCVGEALIPLTKFEEAIAPASKAYEIMLARKAAPRAMIPMQLTLSAALWNSKKDMKRALALTQAAYATGSARLKKQLMPSIKTMERELATKKRRP